MDRHLKKQQRVYRESDIGRLFARGKRVVVPPVSGIVFLRGDGGGPKLMVSVSKKRFKHAVDRVRVKRLLREAFRLNKPELDADIALVYTDTLLPDYATILRCVTDILQRMQQKYRPQCLNQPT